MVEENILKVKANKMRQNLSQRADSVMTIEKRRLQLETAMKERLHEISLYKCEELTDLKFIYYAFEYIVLFKIKRK